LQLETEVGRIEVRTETPGIFLGLFNPELPVESTPGLRVTLPNSDLSFLYQIPAIGTKFHSGKEMSAPSIEQVSPEAKAAPLVLWFRFD
jgi:hypothetical protein